MAKLSKQLIYGFAIVLAFVLIASIFYLSYSSYYSKKSSYIHPEKITEHTIDGYTVVEFKDLLSHEECDEIVRIADKKGYVDSEVYNDNAVQKNKIGDIDTEFRLSKTCWIENYENPIVEKIADYSTYLTKIPKENQEALQVARYNLHGKFNSHYDCCVFEDEEKCLPFNGNAGQRRSTLMVYLNDDFEGGETEFEKIGLTIKPEKGKAILFWSTDDDGNLIDHSMHRGNKVTKGIKMICTKWSHMHKWENIPVQLVEKQK